MGNFKLNLLPFYFLLLVLFTGSLRAGEVEDLMCTSVSCGHGKCKVTMDGPFAFECECTPGWKQYPLKIESWTYPPCTLPSCTINYDCSSPWTPPPNLDISSPCTYVFCGEGSCEETDDGYGYRCNCNPGSANFGNSTASACLKQCSLGGDCATLETLKKNGSSMERNISSNHLLLTTLLFIAIFLGWST